MSSKISVIIPIYNVEDYLAQCLESVIGQTLEETEIICVNDGSKDGSKEIIEAFSKKDSRIIAVNKANGGYGAACNTGLRLASGEYISIIEPDDYIDKNMFKDLYTLAEENKADIVKSSFYELKDSDGINEAEISKVNWSEDYKMPSTVFKIQDCSQLLYFHPSIWSCIYKKEFLNRHNITFVEAKGAGWVDNPFQIETLCLAQRILYTDNAYYYYRLTNPSSSSNIVNITNPFDRSDEVHSFLRNNEIQNENILAHLYKREIGYIHTILGGLPENLFDFACEKIEGLIGRMDKNVIHTNRFVNDYEKDFYEQCKSRKGISSLMCKLKKNNEGIEIVKAI